MRTKSTRRRRKGHLTAPAVNHNHLVGKVIAGWYPRHNFHGVPTTYEECIAKIIAVRDESPIDPETFQLNPLQRHGKVPLACVDLVKGEERQLYLDLFRSFELLSAAEVRKIDRASIALRAAISVAMLRAAEGEAEADVAGLSPKPTVTFLVDTPSGWKPQSVLDLPPNVERVEHDCEFTARAFVSHFNRLEMKEPTGRWAVCK